MRGRDFGQRGQFPFDEERRERRTTDTPGGLGGKKVWDDL